MKTKLAPIKPKKSRAKAVAAPRGAIFRTLRQFLQRDSAAEIALYVLAIAGGAFFPICGYVSFHSASGWPSYVLTVCCLAFSLPTCWQFGQVAFDGVKGKGFALALELAMLVAPKFFAIAALCVLVVVNVVACYYNLSTGKKFSDQLPATV